MRLSLRTVQVLIALILTISLLACTGSAEEAVSNSSVTQTTTEQAVTTSTTDNESLSGITSYGGIRPVDPNEFSGKFTEVVSDVQEAGKPLVATLSTLTIMIGAVLLIIAFIIGKSVLKMAAGLIVFAGIGLVIYMNAPAVTGIFLWVSSRF